MITIFHLTQQVYYTLVEESDGVVKPVKLGWEEMSKETFLRPKDKLIYPETNSVIRDIPLPIYCLSQSDSYLADKKELERMKKDIITYIKEKAIFLFEKDGLGFIGNERVNENNFQKHLNLEKLPIVKIDEAILKMQNWEPTQKS